MSQDTQLKKEFKEKDLSRIRNIIEKRYGDATSIQTGYSKQEVEHVEGDEWEEGGKKWTIKNGIKQTITKFDALKQASKFPLKCPCCGNHFQLTDLNKKMYHIHGTCFNCVTEMETKLKLEGKYEEYERNIMNLNKNQHLTNFEGVLDEYVNSLGDSTFAENGDKEKWIGGSIDYEYVKKVKEQIKQQKQISL